MAEKERAASKKVSFSEMFDSINQIYADPAHQGYDIPIIVMPVFWKYSPFFIDRDTCSKLNQGKFVTVLLCFIICQLLTFFCFILFMCRIRFQFYTYSSDVRRWN